MRRIPSASVAFLGAMAVVMGCSSSDPGGFGASGGAAAVASGGTSTTTPTANGGATSSSGGTGGAISVGGATAMGGTGTLGGAATTTGGNSTGGGSAKGGSSAGGGASAMGGSATAGGSKASGGATSNGGSKASGGTTSVGGAAGGSKASGGSATMGGANAGGSKASGGTTAAGGAVPAGGSTAIAVKCNNLLSAAGTTGKAKPSGTAGGLKVLDWAGFQGAVSFTFDDGNSSQVSNYTQLNATGARMTFFLVSGWTSATNAIWKTALANGHEIGNHTKSHNSAADLADLQAAQTFIQSTFGITAYSMAAPNGDGSWASVAPSVLLFNRGVSDGLIGPRDSTNQYSLPAYLPPEGASSSVMDAAVNAAKSAGKWKIFCVHGFSGDASAYHPVDATAMTTTMSNAVKGGVWTDTMTNVGAYWKGQALIPATATTSATWTLPAHFPPNMCLRVTTTGGTVKQNGVEVPWNDHGYYEIALDAKSVTVE